LREAQKAYRENKKGKLMEQVGHYCSTAKIAKVSYFALLVGATTQKQCTCGAKDERGRLIKHATPRHSSCLYNTAKRQPKARPLKEVVDPPAAPAPAAFLDPANSEVFVVKAGFQQTFRDRRGARQLRLNRVIDDAVRRFNKIRFLGMKLVTLHVLRLRSLPEPQVPTLDQKLFRTCCNVVSRESPDRRQCTASLDAELNESFRMLMTSVPEGFAWPHRQGIGQALKYAAIEWLVSVQVDLTSRFCDRLRRWIAVRLSRLIMQNDMTEAHLWTIAARIVEKLSWNEKRAVAEAIAAEEALAAAEGRIRRPVHVEMPNNPYEEMRQRAERGEPIPRTRRSLPDLLGPLPDNFPQLSAHTKDSIWTLFTRTLLRKLNGPLPLCPRNFKSRGGL
jgi:hypothetical protein